MKLLVIVKGVLMIGKYQIQKIKVLALMIKDDLIIDNYQVIGWGLYEKRWSMQINDQIKKFTTRN